MSIPPRFHRPRRGRLLIECMVSLLLLATAGAALVSGARAASMLADDAVLVASAHAAGRTVAERTQWAACDTGSWATVQQDGRVRLDARHASQSSAQAVSVRATLTLSPLAAERARVLTMSTARPCE